MRRKLPKKVSGGDDRGDEDEDGGREDGEEGGREDCENGGRDDDDDGEGRETDDDRGKEDDRTIRGRVGRRKRQHQAASSCWL